MTQEGLIALTRSIKSFQPKKGVLFWTYAEAVVRNAITDYVRKKLTEYEAPGSVLSLENSTSDDDSKERAFEESALDNFSLELPWWY